jgi:hypothetical protein
LVCSPFSHRCCAALSKARIPLLASCQPIHRSAPPNYSPPPPPAFFLPPLVGYCSPLPVVRWRARCRVCVARNFARRSRYHISDISISRLPSLRLLPLPQAAVPLLCPAAPILEGWHQRLTKERTS